MNHNIYIKAYRLNSKEWVQILLSYIKKNNGATVTDIANALGIGHSDASQRLKILKSLGYIEESKQDKGHFKSHSITGRTFNDVMKEYVAYLQEIIQ